MLRLLAVTFALLLSPAAWAEQAIESGLKPERDLAPDRVYITLASRHLNIDPTLFGRADWNEFNPGVILTWEDRGQLGLNYSLGLFQNSYADRALFAGIGKTWEIVESGVKLGFVTGLADYGQNARLIGTQIGSSGWIITGGAQLEYRNIFLQLQPAGPQAGGGMGAVLVGGLSIPLGD